MSSHPLLSRAHLEALLVAHTLLDVSIAELVTVDRLSPAANTMLDFIARHPTLARVSLKCAVDDEYTTRLAKRVTTVTLAELCYYPIETLLGLVNDLPVIGERVRSAA